MNLIKRFRPALPSLPYNEETRAMIDAAERKVSEAISTLTRIDAFYATKTMSLSRVMVPPEVCNVLDIRWGATDGVYLYVNPANIGELTNAELVTFCAHESEHCLQLHHVRQSYRIRMRWNIATDLNINARLTVAGFSLRDDFLTKVTEDLAGRLKLSPESMEALSTTVQLADLSSEEIYWHLFESPRREEEKQNPQPEKQGQDGSQDGQSQGESPEKGESSQESSSQDEGEATKDANSKDPSSDNEDQTGRQTQEQEALTDEELRDMFPQLGEVLEPKKREEGESQGSESQGSEGESAEGEEEAESFDAGSFDAEEFKQSFEESSDSSRLSDSDKASLESSVSREIAQSAMVSIGTGRGGDRGRAHFSEILEDQIPSYAEILERYVTEVEATDMTYARIHSGYYVTQGIVYPGEDRESQGVWWFGVDLSGSVTQRELDKIMATISALVQRHSPKETNVYFFDDEPLERFTFTQGEPVECTPKRGRGGNDACMLDAVEDAIAKGEDVPLFVAIFTDCYTPYPKEAPDYPVLWFDTKGEVYKTAQTGRPYIYIPPFGELHRCDLRDERHR